MSDAPRASTPGAPPRRGDARDRESDAPTHASAPFEGAPASHPPPRIQPVRLTGALRTVTRRVHGLRTAVGLLLLGGMVLGALGTLAFAWVAARVRAGRTQAFDEAVLSWVGSHRGAAWFEALMLEITFLGTGTVVLLLAAVVGVFLALTDHRWSAALLGAATVGGIVLNNLLKQLFDRPRPQVFAWGTHALTTSFPSGHAMSAAAVYGTLAYLAARLARRRRDRVAIYAAAAVIILLVCATRVYLGVHYPSDVFAGLVVGLAWAGFCMAMLEAVRRMGRRRGGGE
jgi:undecaprenyl-diphosphatase